MQQKNKEMGAVSDISLFIFNPAVYITIFALILSSIIMVVIYKIYQHRTMPKSDKFEVAGFVYDPDSDIFYSELYAWQREYGYCYLYDAVAPIVSLIMDSEPVIFEYKGKVWLIEFWKGQYGMTTGAEVGIYSTKHNHKNKKRIFFEGITDDEMLEISYTLYKNGEIYFSRAEEHWWLTGFRLGDFANPNELKMHITINFKDLDMQTAFINELKRIGYSYENINVFGNKVYIVFDKPYSKKPWTNMKWLENMSQKHNKFFVDTYQEMTKGADTFEDKMLLLKQNNTKLYKKIMKIGMSKKLYTSVAHFRKKDSR